MIAVASSGPGVAIAGWPGFALAVFGLVGVAAGVVAYFKAQFARATIDEQNKLITAQAGRIDDLEDHVERCDKDVAALKEANVVLSDQVSGTSAIKELSALMDRRFGEVLDVLDAQAEGIGRLSLALGRRDDRKG